MSRAEGAKQASDGRRQRALDVLGVLAVAFFTGIALPGHDPAEPPWESIGHLRFQRVLALHPAAGEDEEIASALGMSDFRALTRRGGASEELAVIGIAHGEGTQLLAPGARLLPSAPPQLQRAGEYLAVRNAGRLHGVPEPAGFAARTGLRPGQAMSVVVYSVPVLGPGRGWLTAEVVCAGALTQPSGGGLRACEALASTLDASGYGSPLQDQQREGYEQALRVALGSYYSGSPQQELQSARYAGGQAQAASRLAGRYRAIAHAIASMSTLDPIAAPAQRRLVERLRRTGRDFAVLASAAATDDLRRWMITERRLAADERSVAAAIREVGEP